MANDSFQRIGLLLQGICQRLAIEVAPILDAVAKMFTDAAKEAGGFGEATSNAFGFVINATEQVWNAIDGVKRAFQVAGRSIAIIIAAAELAILEFANAIINGPVSAINTLIQQANKIPGINLGEVGQSGFGRQVEERVGFLTQVIKEGASDINDILLEPLAGTQFQEFVRKARDASEQAAREAVSLSSMLFGDGEDDEAGGVDEALQRRIQSQLDRLRESGMSRMELLERQYADETQVLADALDQRMIEQDEYHALLEQSTKRHQERLSEIEREQLEARRQMTSDILGDLSTLMNTQSKKLFAIGKGAAIAQAIVSTHAGMAKALELGPIAGPIAAAAVGVKGFAQVQAIRSQTIGGGGGSMSMSGMSNTQSVNAASQPTNAVSQGSGGGTNNVNFTINAVDAKGVREVLQSERGFIVSMINQAANNQGRVSPA
jgi:hypothetical protein